MVVLVLERAMSFEDCLRWNEPPSQAACGRSGRALAQERLALAYRGPPNHYEGDIETIKAEVERLLDRITQWKALSIGSGIEAQRAISTCWSS
jgi:hypothetical protein